MRLVMVAALTLGAVPAAAEPVLTMSAGEALLAVEAEGRYSSAPDQMTIYAGTVTTATTASEAVRANGVLAQRLNAAVREQGVAERDLRTSNFSVRPSFQFNRSEPGPDGKPPLITGYVVTNQLKIRLRKLSDAEALIARLFEAGANSVQGPSFSLSDDKAARRAAERSAIAEARAEAENYASALGKRVGRLVRMGDRRTFTNPESSEIVVMGSRLNRTPIEPGVVETRATVFVEFALVDR